MCSGLYLEVIEMKIIDPGKNRFKCSRCNCTFEWTGSDLRYSYLYGDWVIDCPKCKKIYVVGS